MFNDDGNVDALETNKLVKLVLLFKLLIDNIELVDNEFKLLKIVVDVVCKFDIFNAEYVDKLFKFVIVELPVKEFIIFNNVVDVALILLIDNVRLAGPGDGYWYVERRRGWIWIKLCW